MIFSFDKNNKRKLGFFFRDCSPVRFLKELCHVCKQKDFYSRLKIVIMLRKLEKKSIVCSDRVNLFKERVFISVKQGFIDYSQGPSATALYIHDLVVNHSTWTNINIDEMKMWNAWFVAFSVMASIRSVECTQDMHIGHKSVFPNFHRKAGASCS